VIAERIHSLEGGIEITWLRNGHIRQIIIRSQQKQPLRAPVSSYHKVLLYGKAARRIAFAAGGRAPPSAEVQA
jgi:hypothetical protein